MVRPVSNQESAAVEAFIPDECSQVSDPNCLLHFEELPPLSPSNTSPMSITARKLETTSTIQPDIEVFDVPKEAADIIEGCKADIGKMLQLIADEKFGKAGELNGKLEQKIKSLNRFVTNDSLPTEVRMFISDLQSKFYGMVISDPRSLFKELVAERGIWKARGEMPIGELFQRDRERFDRLIFYLCGIKIPAESDGKDHVLLTLEDVGYQKTWTNSASGIGLSRPANWEPSPKIIERIERAIQNLKIFAARTGWDKEMLDHLIDMDNGNYNEGAYKLAAELSKDRYRSGLRPDHAGIATITVKGAAKGILDLVGLPIDIALLPYELAVYAFSNKEVRTPTPYETAIDKHSNDKTDVMTLVFEGAMCFGSIMYAAKIAVLASKTISKTAKFLALANIRNMGPAKWAATGLKHGLKTASSIIWIDVDSAVGVSRLLAKGADGAAQLVVSATAAAAKKGGLKNGAAKSLARAEIMPIEQLDDEAVFHIGTSLVEKDGDRYVFRRKASANLADNLLGMANNDLVTADVTITDLKNALRASDFRVVAKHDETWLVQDSLGRARAIKVTQKKIRTPNDTFFPEQGLYYSKSTGARAANVKSSDGEYVLLEIGEQKSSDEIRIMRFDAGSNEYVAETSHYFSKDNIYADQSAQIADEPLMIDIEDDISQLLEDSMVDEGTPVLIIDRSGKVTPLRDHFDPNATRYATDHHGIAYRKSQTFELVVDRHIETRPERIKKYNRVYDGSGKPENIEMIETDLKNFSMSIAGDDEILRLANEHVPARSAAELRYPKSIEPVGATSTVVVYIGPKKVKTIFYRQKVIVDGKAKDLYIEARSSKQALTRLPRIIEQLNKIPSKAWDNVEGLEFYSQRPDVYGLDVESIAGTYDPQQKKIRIFNTVAGENHATVLPHEFGHGMANLPQFVKRELAAKVMLIIKADGAKAHDYYLRMTGSNYFTFSWEERFCEAMKLYVIDREGLRMNDPRMAGLIEDILAYKVEGTEHLRTLLIAAIAGLEISSEK